MSLHNHIEAILFYKGSPVQVKELASILDVSEEDIEAGLHKLQEMFQDRGVTLIRKGPEVMLGTNAGSSGIIEKLIKHELEKDLGKAGLETLTTVLYQGPITRAEIDYIRGVNSNFSLRQLMVRGLVERVPHPSDQRSFLYQSTFDLLAYLGIEKVEDMPEYKSVRNEIAQFKVQNASNSEEETSISSDEHIRVNEE